MPCNASYTRFIFLKSFSYELQFDMHFYMHSYLHKSFFYSCKKWVLQFRTTCTYSRVNWDIASIVQKKGESPREFIQCFCNKRNIISEVDNKSTVMFFKKGLRDPALIHKLAMKNPRTSEAMFTIANKYALAEELTLYTIEQKKEKDSGRVDQPSSSKGNDKKRKADHSINAVERP
jgi:hypothetical protein